MPTVNTKADPDRVTSNTDTFFDRDWLKSTFMISDEDALKDGEYGKWIRANRYASSADMKFTSTTPGMSIACNPKPQFTRYADIRNRGKLYSRPEQITTATTGHQFGLGMGRYYSEAIDDNQQRIFMRFGSPQYMSMLMWITASFDVHKAALQNRGVITSVLLDAINITTKLFTIFVAPVLTLGKVVFNAILQPGKFVSVRDNMYVYWATVENLMNSFVVRRTMVPFFESAPRPGNETVEDESWIQKGLNYVKSAAGVPDVVADAAVDLLGDMTARADNTMNQEMRPTPGFVRSLNEIIPDVIDPSTGRIRINAIALRAQAAFNRMLSDDARRADEVNVSRDFTGYPITGEVGHDTYFTNKHGEATTFVKWIFGKGYDWFVATEGEEDDLNPSVTYNPIYTGPDNQPLDPTLEEPPEEEPTPDSDVPTVDDDEDSRDGDVGSEVDPDVNREKRIEANKKKKKASLDSFGEFFFAELTEGAAFAVFNVNSTGSIGESFSNSVANNPIESVFNSLSSKARNIMNNLKHVTNVPLVGDALGFLGDAAAVTMSNATLGLANPLLALAYGANISLPKQWESSSASLPKASYSLKLTSPYGNAYSQLFNIYLPLSMIMAGALPKKTGLDSYTSPFVCQLYDRGRVNIPLGIIDSFSVTRGTSNLAFTRGGHPNAIDVDFSVLDLNEIIAVDISSNGLLTRLVEIFDVNVADDAFTNYANTIAGVDVYNMYYKVPAARLKLAERTMALKAITNPHPADLAAFTVNNIPLIGPIGKAIFGHSAATHIDVTKR